MHSAGEVNWWSGKEELKIQRLSTSPRNTPCCRLLAVKVRDETDLYEIERTEMMTKQEKLQFVILEIIAFISPVMIYAFNSIVGIICFLPPIILAAWSLKIIRKRTALAISGLVVTVLSVLLFLAIALPSYSVYKQRHKQQQTGFSNRSGAVSH